MTVEAITDYNSDRAVRMNESLYLYARGLLMVADDRKMREKISFEIVTLVVYESMQKSKKFAGNDFCFGSNTYLHIA